MKKDRTKLLVNILNIVSFIILVIGLVIGYVGAEVDDAPGLALIIWSFSIAGCLVLLGISKIIVLLNEIKDKLDKGL